MDLGARLWTSCIGPSSVIFNCSTFLISKVYSPKHEKPNLLSTPCLAEYLFWVKPEDLFSALLLFFFVFPGGKTLHEYSLWLTGSANRRYWQKIRREKEEKPRHFHFFLFIFHCFENLKLCLQKEEKPRYFHFFLSVYFLLLWEP